MPRSAPLFVFAFIMLIKTTSHLHAQSNTPPQNAGHAGVHPILDQLLALETLDWNTAISPDGKRVAYGLWKADTVKNINAGTLFIAEAGTGDTYKVPLGEMPFWAVKWSPDGKWVSFISTASQIFVMPAEGGKLIQLTDTKSGVHDYAWSADGSQIAFSSASPGSDLIEQRKKRYGDYQVVGKEGIATTDLYTIEVAHALVKPAGGTKCT